MRAADGVDTRLLQLEEPTLHRGAVVGRTKYAEIVVETHALQLHAASVQLEPARVGIKRDRADAVAERLARDVKRVEVRIVDVPKARRLHRERAFFFA